MIRVSSAADKVLTSSAAVMVCLPGSIRMSSKASSLNEKPRCGRSSCGEETPRSNRIASIPGTCASTSNSSKSPKFPRSSMTSHAFSAEAEERRFLAAAKAISSWSMPIRRPPSPSRLATSEECPAPPSVESTNVCCGLRFEALEALGKQDRCMPVLVCHFFHIRTPTNRAGHQDRCSPAGFHDAWYPKCRSGCQRQPG